MERFRLIRVILMLGRRGWGRNLMKLYFITGNKLILQSTGFLKCSIQRVFITHIKKRIKVSEVDLEEELIVRNDFRWGFRFRMR